MLLEMIGSLFRRTATSGDLADDIEDIRESMLAVLGPKGAQLFPSLCRRIGGATDQHALWYLRSDLMAALAQMHGEAVARERISALTELFDGLVPKGLSSRPAPLGAR